MLLPSGAVVDKIEWKKYIRYGTRFSSNPITATVLESCGTSGYRVNYPPTASCSGAISANLLSGSGSTANERKLESSLWNSASVGTYSVGTGWKTASICSSSTACNATTGNHNYIMNAISNGGTIGMGAKYTTATTISQYSYNTGSTQSYLQVTYTGGTDSDAPKDGFIPYTGITSYKTGARTFFTTLTDISGIDTTTTNGVHLHYSVNNGSYSAVKATSHHVVPQTPSVNSRQQLQPSPKEIMCSTSGHTGIPIPATMLQVLEDSSPVAQVR